MIKELKFLFFLFIILLFVFLTLEYYFSDNNEKNSYKSFNNNNKKIIFSSKNLIFLKSDTVDIVQYIENINNKKKKNYTFWELINNND